MRLNIEPSASKKASYYDVQKLSSGSRTDTRVLPLILEPQQLSNWCWAALSASIGRYYGAVDMGQPEIAGKLLAMDCSRHMEEPEVATACNTVAMLDDALRLVGCFSHWSPAKPAFERIAMEIDAGRPVCLCLEWKFGGTHYAVITGYSARAGDVYIEDPLHGSSVQAYASFPGGYLGSAGYWRGTYWTQSPLNMEGR
ncbi:hypothetical protein GK047_12485 [Paenibacillus sp. SYP-B3998]|uniref:Peptidase C39-like domain-containing protein n=1 Tax=Paenibacillus sp. SYP-B3998 TaxID=2678564 RepID=A0A6G3ZXQ3_9BACL|nr:papain-like cysteine protease family protein [Paenibacillus sp. SYP-B3998]NEW06828.1 hypothetical protein [Paenibacillus sp. SYP-B3998]